MYNVHCSCCFWPLMYNLHCTGCFWPCTYIVKDVSGFVCTLFRVFLAVFEHCTGFFWPCMYIAHGVSCRKCTMYIVQGVLAMYVHCTGCFWPCIFVTVCSVTYVLFTVYSVQFAAYSTVYNFNCAECNVQWTVIVLH